MKKIKRCLITIALVAFIASCKKNDVAPVAPPKVATGIYTLNQGIFNSNNTTISYYDFTSGKATTDFFNSINGFGLGDTGSDMIIYGGKLYVVMNVSSYVAVLNAYTGKFIDSVSFINGGVARGPQNIAIANGKVFVSSTDNSVSVIDTNSLAIIKTITVGSNPAQMVVSGSNLYVSNTGGYSASFDSTVSVINLGTLTETGKITVGINPGSIAADNAGNIYVACTGDYATVPAQMVKINTGTNAILKAADTAAGIVRYYNNNLYITGGYLGAASVRVLSTADFSQVKSFVSDGTGIENPYGLDIDDATGDVYIGDAKDYVSAGTVFCFDTNGKLKFSFGTAPTASPIKTVLIAH
jgi:YVTN family beta-propeller protein